MMKEALITGVTGQDGSFLAEFLLEKGYDVHGTIRRSSVDFRERIAHLEGLPNFHLHYADLGDSMSILQVVKKVKPNEIYNLAAQSHVQVSFDSPEFTADVVDSDNLGKCVRYYSSAGFRRWKMLLGFMADHVKAYRENHMRSNALLDSLRYIYKVAEIAKFKLRILLVRCLLFLLFCIPSYLSAQDNKPGTVDIFMGVDFNYRDIYFNNRVYDILINLTPGVRWNMGHRWEVAAQAFVPVVNQYGDRYKNVRLNMAVLSKQLAFGQHWKMKVTGGLFGAERYGLDMKNMFILNRWLAMTAQVGLTGYCSMASGWEASTMERLTAQAGPEIYLHRWNTQISVRGGRYVYGDYGVVGEGYRHFKHVSVGVYASYSDKGKEDAGFKVIVMLPPYKRTARKVNIRPASNFRLTYSVEAETYANRTYFTDPEQNERTGWFDRNLLSWGTDTMSPDFIVKERKEEEK